MGATTWVTIVAPIYIVLVNLLLYCLDQQSLFWRKFLSHKRAPLFIVGRRPDIDPHAIPQRFAAWDLIDPRGTATSHIAPRWCIALWRALVVPFYIGGLVQFDETDTLDGGFMKFYTNWSFTLLMATNLLGVVVVVVDMIRCPHGGARQRPEWEAHQNEHLPDSESGIAQEVQMTSTGADSRLHVADRTREDEATASTSQQSPGASTPDQSSREPHYLTSDGVDEAIPPRKLDKTSTGWGILQALHLICLETVAPAELFLSVFFWATIFDGDQVGNQMFVHTVQNVFPLVDIGILSKTAIVSSHFLFLVMYTTVYAVFMWIYGGITEDWPYTNLTVEPKAMVLYILLPVALLIAFIVYFGLAALRERCFVGSSARSTERATTDLAVQSVAIDSGHEGGSRHCGKGPGGLFASGSRSCHGNGVGTD